MQTQLTAWSAIGFALSPIIMGLVGLLKSGVPRLRQSWTVLVVVLFALVLALSYVGGYSGLPPARQPLAILVVAAAAACSALGISWATRLSPKKE